jgi:hypothetical protein
MIKTYIDLKIKTYKTIIVLIYGFESRSLTLREEKTETVWEQVTEKNIET